MFQKLVLEYFKSKMQWVANTQPNSNWHICLIQKHYLNWEWWHMSLITTHFRKISEDPFEFKAILVYITSSRTMDYVKRSCLKTKFKKVSSGGHEHLCLGEVEVVGAQTWVMWGWIYSVSQMPMDWKFANWSICLPHAISPPWTWNLLRRLLSAHYATLHEHFQKIKRKSTCT